VLRSKLFVALLTAVTTTAFAACSTAPQFDVVIVGGSMIDGTGAEPRLADVGIKGDRIVAIGTLADRSASQRIDATGKTVAPGFIDVMGRSSVSLLANGLAASRLRQGITTELLVDGSPAFWTPTTADPDALRVAGVKFDWQGFDGYFRKLASRGTAINVGSLAALSLAGTDRVAFVDNAMRDGAWGVVEDTALDTHELARVAAAVGRSDGVLMFPSDSPGAATDDSFFSIADAAHSVVITDVTRERTGATIAQLNTRIARTAERHVAVYTTVIPSESLTATSIADALQYGGVMVATNSEGTDAFSWLLRRIVHDEHLMELKEAIRRSTSVPAAAFNIPRRGILRENYFADVVVFDPSTVVDRSTTEKPNQYAGGIDYVLVNGVITATPRGITGARAGYGLLRNKTRR